MPRFIVQKLLQVQADFRRERRHAGDADGGSQINHDAEVHHVLLGEGRERFHRALGEPVAEHEGHLARKFLGAGDERRPVRRIFFPRGREPLMQVVTPSPEAHEPTGHVTRRHGLALRIAAPKVRLSHPRIMRPS